ncbi:MAG: S8 family serine peptidase, partial [candidate division Zixibacteria bacterium]
MNLRLINIGKHITASLVLTVILTTAALAGELSNKLAQTVAGKGPTELVRVWIELPEVESSASLKATAKALATTRSERHKMTFERLKENHTASQKDLLSDLKALSGGNKASLGKIRGHWIINVIEAEVTVEQLYALADRADIETIHAVPRIVSIAPDKISSVPSLSLTPVVESNLEYIRADVAWLNGYTGAGRVICSFDTGVDGLHPALYDSWKGHDGDAAAAWFDPVGREPFPHTLEEYVIGGRGNHGTSTMGLILGHDDVTGDTVGVALGAKWISAGVIDIEGASIIDAFEWAADP